MDYDRILLELLNRIQELEDRVTRLEGGDAPEVPDASGEIGKASKKYRFLSDYLQNSHKDSVALTLPEIEAILGFSLPNSARVHRAFWSNTTSHSIALSWLSVGYVTTEADIPSGQIVFEKRRAYAT